MMRMLNKLNIMEQIYPTWMMSKEVLPQFHQTVSTLIDTLIKPESLKRDLFIALLLIVMKENNFLLLKGTEGGSIDIVDYITSKKMNDRDIYVANVALNGFQTLPLKIIACPLNDAILIIGTVPELYKETYSLCLKTSRYIHTSTLGIPSDFTNLNELFTVFKDKIVNPLKGSVLNYHKYPSGNLSGLPDDAVHKILLRLPIRDVLNVFESCKKLHRIAEGDPLWFRLCVRDFEVKNKIEGASWREVYMKLYVEELKLKYAVGSYGYAGFQEFANVSHYSWSRGIDARWEVIL